MTAAWMPNRNDPFRQNEYIRNLLRVCWIARSGRLRGVIGRQGDWWARRAWQTGGRGAADTLASYRCARATRRNPVRLSINNPASRGPASRGRPTAAKGREPTHQHRRRRRAGRGRALRSVAEQAVLLEQTAVAARLRLAGRRRRRRRARLARRLLVTTQLEVTGFRLTRQQQRTGHPGRYQHPQVSSHEWSLRQKMSVLGGPQDLLCLCQSRGLSKKSTSGR